MFFYQIRKKLFEYTIFLCLYLAIKAHSHSTAEKESELHYNIFYDLHCVYIIECRS